MYQLAESYYRLPDRFPTDEEIEYAKYWYLQAADNCNNSKNTHSFASISFALGNIYGKKFLSKQVPPNTDFEDACEAVKWFVYAYVFDFPCKDDITQILDYCGINFTDEDFQALRNQAVRKFYPQ